MQRFLILLVITTLSVITPLAALPGPLDLSKRKNISKFIKRYSKLDEKYRKEYLESCRDSLDKKSLSYFHKALGSKSASKRETVISILKILKDSRSLGSLARLSITDKNEKIRKSAVLAYKAINDNKAGPIYKKFLKSSDHRMVARSAQALGEIGDPYAAGALAEVLGNFGAPRRAKAYFQWGKRASYISGYENNDGVLTPIVSHVDSGGLLVVNRLFVYRVVVKALNDLDLGFQSDDPKEWQAWHKARAKK